MITSNLKDDCSFRVMNMTIDQYQTLNTSMTNIFVMQN